MTLTGQTVLITGAASGIGLALAKGFLADGAKVVAVDVTAAGLDVLDAAGATTFIADVTDATAVQAMVDKAIEATGRLDVLFNNAGLGLVKPVEEMAPGEFERIINVNLIGPYLGTKAALPQMRKQGYGRIINTVSRGAEIPSAGWSAYGASKAGLYSLTRTVASEVADMDILVNALIPGPTKSGMMPRGQDPAVVYPTARMLATLPADGPSGKVFWNEKEYILFSPENETYQAGAPQDLKLT